MILGQGLGRFVFAGSVYNMFANMFAGLVV